MSALDTDPLCNFCDPHWELICHHKWHPWTSEIFTALGIAVGTHSHTLHDTKTTPAFFKDWRWNLLVATSKFSLSGGTVQPENTYSCILKVAGQVWERKNRLTSTLITSNTSVHLPELVSNDLTIKSDSILTNLIRSLCNKTSAHKMLTIIPHYPWCRAIIWWTHFGESEESKRNSWFQW